MKKTNNMHRFRTWLPFLFLAIILIVVFRIFSEIDVIYGWLLGFFRAIAPFVWGLMIAYVLNIPREGIEKLLAKTKQNFIVERKKGFSIVLTYLVMIFAFVLIARLIMPRIYESITDFIAFLPNLIDQLEYYLIYFSHNYNLNFDAFLESFSLDELLQNIYLPDIDNVFDTLLSFSIFVFRVVLALISSIYFLVEGAKLKAFIKRALEITMSHKSVANIFKYGRSMNSYFKLYIRCQVLDAVILGTIMTVVMSVTGINYAFALGPMLGFANLIPYFGSIIGTIIAIVVIFLTEGVTMGIIMAIVLIVLQQFDANFIFPRLLGNSMKISPLLVIIGITIGNFFYGVLGMIMAIPIVTVLQNILKDILDYYEARKALVGEESTDVLE